MGRDGAVVGSSIVLLQERFKQLQRLKEMREGKQLLRQLPDHQGTDAAAVMMGFPASDHDPLALGLSPRYRVVEAQQFPAGGGGRGPHGFFEKKPDVDTSLRL